MTNTFTSLTLCNQLARHNNVESVADVALSDDILAGTIDRFLQHITDLRSKLESKIPLVWIDGIKQLHFLEGRLKQETFLLRSLLNNSVEGNSVELE